eukprot:scaffold83577_cov30-Tisochrysis_lutea.AAC.1
MSLLAKCQLSYFPLAGRAEASRLALAYAGIQFTDERIGFSEWAERKPSTPFGQMPVLTLADGTEIAQQKAILRFIGKQTGLYPEDPIEAAHVDELIDAFDGISPLINDAGRNLDQEGKEAARKEMVTAGPAFVQMSKCEAFVQKHGKDGHAVGSTLTIADFYISVAVSFVACGFYDGVGAYAFKPFPGLCAVRKTIGGLPSVKKFYDELAEDYKKMYKKEILNMAEDFEF